MNLLMTHHRGIYYESYREADNDTIFSALKQVVLYQAVLLLLLILRFTVSIVEDSDIAFGDETHVTSSTNGVYALCFDGVNNRFVIVYIDNNDSSYGKAVVGEVDGTSITFGTPVNFNAGDLVI